MQNIKHLLFLNAFLVNLLHTQEDTIKKWAVYRRLRSDKDVTFYNITFCGNTLLAGTCSNRNIKLWNFNDNHTRDTELDSDSNLTPIVYSQSNNAIIA